MGAGPRQRPGLALALPQGACSGVNIVTCTLSEVGAASAISLAIPIRVQQPVSDVIEAQIALTALQPDLDLDNNTAQLALQLLRIYYFPLMFY